MEDIPDLRYYFHFQRRGNKMVSVPVFYSLYQIAIKRRLNRQLATSYCCFSVKNWRWTAGEILRKISLYCKPLGITLYLIFLCSESNIRSAQTREHCCINKIASRKQKVFLENFKNISCIQDAGCAKEKASVANLEFAHFLLFFSCLLIHATLI